MYVRKKGICITLEAESDVYIFSLNNIYTVIMLTESFQLLKLASSLSSTSNRLHFIHELQHTENVSYYLDHCVFVLLQRKLICMHARFLRYNTGEKTSSGFV